MQCTPRPAPWLRARNPGGLSALPPGFSDVLKELPKLLEAIFKGPKWAIAILFGIGLIWLGHQMTIGGFG